MNYVARAGWGARSPRGRATFATPKAIFLHHTTGATLGAELSDDWVRNIQRQHQAQGWDDIGYSFLYDAFGNVFEGRGWNVIGAHTPGWNDEAHAFAYLGDGDQPLPELAQGALRWLIAESDRRFGALPINGHRQAKSTHCPGDWIFNHRGDFRGGSVPTPPPIPNPSPPQPPGVDWLEEVIAQMRTIDLRNAASVPVRDNNLVDNLQGLLTATQNKAWDPKGIDNVGGANTLAAVNRFQEWAFGKADGIVGPNTWRRLITH